MSPRSTRNIWIPGGLQIKPYYDRSQLVDAAIHTVTGSVSAKQNCLRHFIVLVLFFWEIFVHVFIVSSTLLVTMPLTFLVMNKINLSANLMSLGGPAIAIGLMVDGSVVVVENVSVKLSHG